MKLLVKLDVAMWPKFGISRYYKVLYGFGIIKIWLEKPVFLRARHGLEILRKCDKSAEIKSHSVLGTNSYICSSYRGKTEKSHQHQNKLTADFNQVTSLLNIFGRLVSHFIFKSL